MSEPGRLQPHAKRLLWIVAIVSSLATALLLLFLAVFPALGLARTYRISTKGMTPTVGAGDHIYVRLEDEVVPRRDGVIFFDSPAHPLSARYTVLVGRCVGLPGDTLEVGGGEVRINGKQVGTNPPPAPAGTTPRFIHGLKGKTTIPPDSYFVAGDNWGNSLDSRHYGYVPQERIRGIPVVRLWPLSRLGKIR